jgi:hypothetical protein
MTTPTHPEVLRDVKREFDKLHVKYPNIDGLIKWSMAQKLVRTLAIADTALLKQNIGL